jgi:predicted transposase YbfD/YdcC
MSAVSGASLKVCFESLEDPRRGEVLHPLVNIVAIALSAVICGCDDFSAIAEFGKGRREWLAKFLDLSMGIPSHDTFNNVLARIKPEAFEACLLEWVLSLHELTEGQIIPIDGKTLRGSYGRGDSKATIHMVSAWAAKNHISLGQVTVDEKSNEITAIPKLLQMIEITGALVTIDAMGCQTEIAETIIAEGGDYCLAVKDNQPKLLEATQEFFEDHLLDDFARHPVRRYATQERGHGRVEEREYFIAPVPEDFAPRSRWKKLRALGIAINNVERQGKHVTEVRYYILSKYTSSARFAEAVRGHWSIENRLHWQLDVSYGEDDCRLWRDHAPANFSLLRRTSLSLLKNEPQKKLGIKNKRLAAAFDTNYLEQVLLRKQVSVR